MPETFDPGGLASGPACVQTLRAEYDIRVSQRLGARIVALARNRIQLSLALIEMAPPASELEGALLQEAWTRCTSISEATPLIDPWGCAVDEDGLLKLVTPDETDAPPPSMTHSQRPLDSAKPDPAPPAPAPHGAPLVTTDRPALAPALVGASHGLTATRTSDDDTPWSDDRLRDAARTLFDAEDPTELVESLRRVFRAALASSVDPVPLLVGALRRRKRVLAVEVGALVKAHLDRETGRAIEDLHGDDEARVRDGVHVLMHRPAGAPLSALTLPALTPLLNEPRPLRQIIADLVNAPQLVESDGALLEPFTDALLDQLTELEASERYALSRFLLAVHARWPDLADVLLGRLGATVDLHMQAWYGNVLARMPLAERERARLVDALVDLFVRHGSDVALAERLKITFTHLGAEPLARLTETAQTISSPMVRSYVVDLWTSYLSGGHTHPPKTVLATFLASEMAARNRTALLAMIRARDLTAGRVDLLALPELQMCLADDETLRDMVVTTLLDEVLHLEDPDDLLVLEFLARLGRSSVEAAFERSREEAALDSRAAPHRFRVFAYVASRQPPAPWLAEMGEVAKGWPFLRRTQLPLTLTGMGLLGRIPGLSEETLQGLITHLLPDDVTTGVTWPQARVRGVLELYESVTCPPALREQVETRLEQIVAAEALPRELLVAALMGIDTLVGRAEPPLRVDALTVTLARMVLRKSRETSLESVLSEALRDDTEGYGVRLPEAWSKEERDLALTILGKIAAHPAVSENLHRMITARLAGFTEDWLDAHERGENLYLHRDTPLWKIMTDLLAQRETEHTVEAVVRVGLRALEVHRHAPANLALERREDVLRLLGLLAWLAPQEPVEVRGSLSIDIPKTALTTLITMGSRENENALLILREIEERVPDRLRGQLETFMTLQRRRKAHA
ncbi:MAG: hypothetical protein EB084_09700 [Proteobacteria bacterium]|nr:hypothetical protein [Pseudomonadota bacterium]